MSETLIVKRCAWALGSQQYLDYHDKEWGVPIHHDLKLFEMLILEGVQAGLSWSLILKKRAGYLQAFDGFDANTIARYDDRKVQELLANPEIVRNRLKIQATIQNARAFLVIQSLYWLLGTSVRKKPLRYKKDRVCQGV
jgi:DNA-3-methyladenine glycosylase I